MEKIKQEESNDCVIIYEKLSPNSAGAKGNRTGRENSTSSFERSGEQLVHSSSSDVANTPVKETGKPKSIAGKPLNQVVTNHVHQVEDTSIEKCIDSAIKSILQTPVDVTEKSSPVKTIVINLVRVSKNEVYEKAGSHAVSPPVSFKPCEGGNVKNPVFVEEKEVLNMSTSSDEFEGFSDISDQDEVLKKLGLHVDALEVNDGETKNQQIVKEIEQFSEVVNNNEAVNENEVLNISGSDSPEDFEGFDGSSDTEKTLKKFECINSMLVQQKCTELNDVKDYCSNEDPSNTETEGSNSEPVKERITRSRSTQDSSVTDSRSKIMNQTEHYFVKEGRYKCKYCEEEKSSASLIRRHLKICSDAPLTVLVSSIQYGLTRPVKKKIQPKRINEKINSINRDEEIQAKKIDEKINSVDRNDEIQAKKATAVQKQTKNKDEMKAKSNSKLIGDKMLKPPKKRGRKAKAKNVPVIEEHFVTLLNACDASFSGLLKPPVMSLVKDRLKRQSLEADNGSINDEQLPEENNNHLKTDTSINIISGRVGGEQPVDQSDIFEKDEKSSEGNDNQLKAPDNEEIIGPENELLNTATCDCIENNCLLLEALAQTNRFEHNETSSEKKLVEDDRVKTDTPHNIGNNVELILPSVTGTNFLESDKTSSGKKVVENSQVETDISDNEESTLEPVTEKNIFENDGKSLKKKFVKNSQVKAITSDKANRGKVTFQSVNQKIPSNNGNSSKSKIKENNRVKTVTFDNLASSGKETLRPVIQTLRKTDTSNNLASRIGLQPIMSTPKNNSVTKIDLQPLLSLEFRKPCPHCSIIITGFNNYQKHVLEHHLKPVRDNSTQNQYELPKQDSVDPTRHLLETQLPNKEGNDSTRHLREDELTKQLENSIPQATNQKPNWKKKIMKNYFDSGKTSDLGRDCTVYSSGYCSSSSTETFCSESSQLKSCHPVKNYKANLVSLGSILELASQQPPNSNSQPNCQPRSNEAVIDSMGNEITPIDKYIKYISDEIQEDNCVCSLCDKKFDQLRFLINHLYSSHNLQSLFEMKT